ncbi:MAG: hypothetical protein QOK47_110, partial [Actinomycetota bacterium]|nr:hypothetical protein [Actinomycetota bacterium]
DREQSDKPGTLLTWIWAPEKLNS